MKLLTVSDFETRDGRRFAFRSPLVASCEVIRPSRANRLYVIKIHRWHITLEQNHNGAYRGPGGALRQWLAESVDAGGEVAQWLREAVEVTA